MRRPEAEWVRTGNSRVADGVLYSCGDALEPNVIGCICRHTQLE